jgi:hypothetical protein
MISQRRRNLEINSYMAGGQSLPPDRAPESIFSPCGWICSATSAGPCLHFAEATVTLLSGTWQREPSLGGYHELESKGIGSQPADFP